MIGICGASGYIGRELYYFLKEKGEKVLGTYCNNEVRGMAKFDLRYGSLDMFNECRFVVVLSAYAKIKYCEENRIEAFWLNVYRTKQLLDHLNRKGIPALFISSDAAEKMLDTTYGKYKKMIEKHIKNKGLKSEWIRPGKINDQNIKRLCEQMWACMGNKK